MRRGLGIFLLVTAAWLILVAPVWARTLDKAYFQSLFMQLAEKQLPWPAEDLVLVRFVAEPEHLQVPEGAREIVRLMQPLHPGPNTLLVDYVYQGKLLKRVRLLGSLEVMLPVVVLKHPLPRHALVSQADVALERRPLTRLPKDVVLHVKDALGLRTRTSLRAGSVLRASALEIPPVVKRGSLVRIVAQGENFLVTAVGEARQDGRPGQIIRVRNLVSKREVFARVVDEKTVRVTF